MKAGKKVSSRVIVIDMVTCPIIHPCILLSIIHAFLCPSSMHSSVHPFGLVDVMNEGPENARFLSCAGVHLHSGRDPSLMADGIRWSLAAVRGRNIRGMREGEGNGNGRVNFTTPDSRARRRRGVERIHRKLASLLQMLRDQKKCLGAVRRSRLEREGGKA
jgi:hypothetical protein